jgi:hypothetical protein
MRHRSEDNTGDCDHYQAAIERIDTGEELPAKGRRFIYGTHSPQQHCRVQECVNPAQTFKNVVPKHAHNERDRDQHDTDNSAADESNDERPQRDYRLVAVLEISQYAFQESPND